MYLKIPGNLINTRFPGILLTERAGVRTRDNLIKSQVLYRLSYTPINYLKCYESMPWTGIEPVTRGFSVLCSTN